MQRLTLVSRRRRGIAAARVALALVGCASPARPAGTAVIASGADLESANPLATVHPLSRQVQRFALLVTLARYDERLRPSPYLARSWKWSDAGRTVELQLDSTLRWHDGEPTTARDVAFTIDAARDPATGYARAAELAGVESVNETGPWSLAVRFRAAPPDLPPIFCELPILPAHLLARVPHADLRRAPYGLAPVGNGPFRFVRRDAEQRWLFARNAAFPPSLGGPPLLERLVVAVVDEATTKFAGLVSGELDMAGISPATARLAAQDRSIRLATYPVLFVNTLVFNVARAPFDDARVRRAVSLSLDRARIVTAAVRGFGVPAAGPVPPDAAFASSELHVEHDPPVADSLLDAAGWRRDASGARRRGAVPLALELWTVGSGDNAVEQLIQADLAARGIRVEIRQRELGAFLAAARSPRKPYDMIVTGIPGDASLAFVAAMFDGAQRGGSLDYAGFHTSTLDSLFAHVRGARTADELRREWWAVQGRLASDAPVAWLFHARGVQGVSRRLLGVEIDLRGELASVTRWHVASDLGARRVARR